MLCLSFLLLLVAVLAIVYATLWSIVQAFCRHLLWGLAVLFVPFANLVFLIHAWSDAKRPFFLHLGGGALLVGAIFMVPKAELQKYVEDSPRLQTAIVKALVQANAAGMTAASAPETAPAKSSSEEKMAALHAREQDILARKSRLQPGDHAAAAALNQEIADYNAARQALVADAERARASGVPAQEPTLAGARP